MRQYESAARQAGRQAHRAARTASPWLVGLGRAGYAAKGVVYVLVGVLAAEVADGAGGATTDSKGALAHVVEAPFGRFLLAAIALGLLGYTVWCLVQALFDTEQQGNGAKGLLVRGTYVVVGLIHAGLALSALQILQGAGSGNSGDSAAQGWTARLLAVPFGQWLTGLAGLIVIGVGAYHLYEALSLHFREHLRLGEMDSNEEAWACWLGRLGFAARGVVFALIGLFLIVAARQAQPQEVRGFGGTLAALAQQPYGAWLLGLVAAGLIASGLYLFVEARFRRMVIS